MIAENFSIQLSLSEGFQVARLIESNKSGAIGVAEKIAQQSTLVAAKLLPNQSPDLNVSHSGHG